MVARSSDRVLVAASKGLGKSQVGKKNKNADKKNARAAKHGGSLSVLLRVASRCLRRMPWVPLSDNTTG